VLSERAARQVFGTADVVGREVALSNVLNMTGLDHGRTATVIGVARDTDTQHRGSREIGVVYLPLAQQYEPLLVLIGRAAGRPADLAASLKTLVRRVDPDLVLDRPAAAADVLTGAFVFAGVVARTAGALALLSLGLAMAGLFGVLSHLVSRRTREMGVRMALGADPARIRRLIVADGLRPVSRGLALGMAAGALGYLALRSRYASGAILGDAIVFLLSPLPIVAAAIAACAGPARRASRVDPNVALRDL
jgi:hypothetical protein